LTRKIKLEKEKGKETDELSPEDIKLKDDLDMMVSRVIEAGEGAEHEGK
jgi:hypothetical protein